MKQAPVVHFEMPAKDKARVTKFYTDVFGWKMQTLGPEMGNYVLAGTTPVDENNMATEPGTINGGFFEYKDDELNRAPHLVISVDNLEENINMIKDAGGEIKGEPMDIPGIGRYVSFKDTEGNVVGILEALPRQK
jgi:predicted enzyme related to lactoylglutathione lyase